MEKRKIAWLIQQAAVAHLRALKSNIKACGRINGEAKIKERRQNKQRGGSCVWAGRLLLPEQQSKATREMPLPWQEVYLWLFSSGTWLLAAVCCAHSSWKSHASSCLRLSLPGGAHRALPHLSGGTTASLIHVCLVPPCVTLLWTFFNFLSKLR